MELIFAFGTAGSRLENVKKDLESAGYTVIGDGVNFTSKIWDIVHIADKTQSGSLGDFAEKLLVRIFFEEGQFPEKLAIIDAHIGKNFGFGYKMWSFIKNNLPNAKIFFVRRDLTKTLGTVMAESKTWVPAYGSCLSNCEKRIQGQHKQFEEFYSFFPEISKIIDSDKDKITDFL